ncbi:MAG: hypothetical protein JWL76_2317 [Thermoleophilia bacterium]|nr:hypothetical protein [Thermoleophilia bacterium]
MWTVSEPRRQVARTGEQGVILIWAIIAIAVMAVVAVTFSMLSNGTIERSKSKSERALSYPHVQSSVTKLGVALQADLASDTDNYGLSAADLATLGPAGAANVATAAGIPTQFRTVGGVYRHGPGSTFVYAGALPVVAYHETASLTSAQCAALGVTPCDTSLHGFWQIYRVELPDVASTTSIGQVVYYVRTWVGPASGSYGSDATVVRIATRPGRFADYQLISDGTVHFRAGAKINGPVHSNGFDTADPATGGVSTPYAIKAEPGVNCSSDGSLTTARKTIVTGASSGCPKQENTNRYITFLRVQTQLDDMAADAATRPDVYMYPTVDNTALAPLEHAYHIQFSGGSFRVKPPFGGWGGWQSAGSGAGAVLFKDDVIVEGGDMTTRFTVAASRPNEGSASIYIRGNVNANVTAPGKTLGLIAQGNVVIDMQGTVGACNVTMVRAAIVAAAGGVTIPPEYATQQIQTGQPRCGTEFVIDGSIAAHRPPLLYWKWVDGTWTGYDDRRYKWDKRLINATPPYFPLTGSWQATSVREANIDCYAGGRKLDANCG